MPKFQDPELLAEINKDLESLVKEEARLFQELKAISVAAAAVAKKPEVPVEATSMSARHCAFIMCSTNRKAICRLPDTCKSVKCLQVLVTACSPSFPMNGKNFMGLGHLGSPQGLLVALSVCCSQGSRLCQWKRHSSLQCLMEGLLPLHTPWLP